jgi:hypothetical protein
MHDLARFGRTSTDWAQSKQSDLLPNTRLSLSRGSRFWDNSSSIYHPRCQALETLAGPLGRLIGSSRSLVHGSATSEYVYWR